jgi:hypothetical protein
MNAYQPTDDALAATRRIAEASSPSKLTMLVTERLKLIVADICKNSAGRVSSTETGYFRDVARGRVKEADFARIAFGARRSPFPADARELIDYVRSLAEAQDRTVLPFPRALLREAIEEAEANMAIERCRFQPTAASLDAAIRETNDHIASLMDLKASLVAERERVTA